MRSSWLCIPILAWVTSVSALNEIQRNNHYQSVNNLVDFDTLKVAEENKAGVKCKNENGEDVDWFLVYKLPKTPGSSDEHLKEGSAHFILLPGAEDWRRSTFAINDSRSIVGRTVEPLNSIYSANEADIAVVLYNDQPPGLDPTIRNGHTKGLMIANSFGGIWLPHSIPHFPIPGPKFGYPAGGLENGQMLFCLSLSLDSLDKVFGGSLELIKATFYNSSIPDRLQAKLNRIHNVIVGKTVKTDARYGSFDVDLNGIKFNVLAKGPKFHREIYADWIAPHFNANLDVQSWLQGSHTFMSNCTSNCTVLNIMEKSMFGDSFSYSDDHSKWAVAQEKQLVCIADLNRSKPQKGRGGVALCTQDSKLWSAFRKLVAKTEPCNSTRTNSWKSYKNHKLHHLKHH